MPYRALIVSPDQDIRGTLHRVLHNADWTVGRCQSLNEFQQITTELRWELIFVSTSIETDFSNEVLSKLEAEIKAERTQVVIVSKNPSTDAAMRSLQAGATDYVVWPLLPSEILAIAQRSNRRTSFSTQSAPAYPSNPASEDKQQFERTMIGTSRAMIKLSKQLFQVANAQNMAVFITGETGTGKEVAARRIHQLSKRPGPFRAINCAAMVESLLESELFGHERGAFTGANAMKKGLWEEAANGTIFLDEITEASPALQAKLLRVLQEGTIRRVGSNQEINVTARVLAASNRDIAKAIEAGDFREDLYFRFGHTLRLPPLRERVEDIPRLAEYFCERTGKGTLITPEAMTLLCNYNWPGNVRELESVISKLANFSGRRIFSEDVQNYIRVHPHRVERSPNPAVLSIFNSMPTEYWPTVQELKVQYVIEAYLYFGREAKVARALGIDYRTVSAIIRKEEEPQQNDISTLLPD